MADLAPTCVIFGGGALGSAVARLAHSRGEGVVVASRNAGSHPGWWRRCELGHDSRVAWVPRGSHLVMAVGPASNEPPDVYLAAARLLSRLMREAPASIVVALPAGAVGETAPAGALATAARGVGASVVSLGPLYGVGDAYLSRQVMVLRGGGSVKVPKTGVIRLLCADDAARAVVSARANREELVVTGGDQITAANATALLIQRFGGTARTAILGDGLHRSIRERLAGWADLPDRWDETRFGPRVSLAQWISRLPGPRRRVGDPPPPLSAR